MITRSKMRRQLYRGGGITNLYPRQKYGIGSWVKDKIRDLIPNELADVAVKAAPFVAPFYPGAAALMRGIGRFDQRGSMSDALKQGALTYAGGRGARYLAGAEGPAGGLDTFSMDRFREGPVGKLFQSGTDAKKLKDADSIKNTPGFMQRATEATIGKVPGLKALPPMVQQQLLVGGLIGGTEYLINYLKGDFRPQEEGESMEEYLAARKETVGQQMRIYMDNYFKFDPEYSQLDDAGRNAFVARYNVAQGGRIGFQTGGTMMDLVENISDPGSPYYEAAKTLQDRKAQSEAALDLLNTTGTTGTTDFSDMANSIITDGGIKYRIGPGGSKTPIGGINVGGRTLFENAQGRGPGTYDAFYDGAYTAVDPDMLKQASNVDPRAGIKESFFNERLSGGERFGDAIPDFDRYGTYTGSDQLIKDYAAAGRGTTQSQLVKLPANHPYADSGPGYYEYDGTNFSLVGGPDQNTPEGMKYMRERFGLKPDTAQIPGAVDTLVASPRTIPTDTGALKVVEPEGIQTVPTKRSFNVMMDEKGNVMKDQGIAQLARDTGVAPDITNLPINNMSDVMRMIGPGTGIPQGTEYDSISMDRSLRENVAANEAQRRRVSGMFEAARSKLPGYGPGPVMPMQINQNNPGYFSNPGVVTQANPGGYGSEQEAIANLGIEKYNTMYNQGGRVGLKHGTPEMGIKSLDAGAIGNITYKGNEGPQSPLKEKMMMADVSNMRQKLFDMGYDWINDADDVTVRQIYDSEMGTWTDSSVWRTTEAKGGRIGYRMGMGPAGLPGIPRMAPDGMEFDMRQNGGFQPLGAKEKKDDVPAMLAKNEFVMTADAVRGAGNGDIELGAQKMYDTMKNLERRMA